jgi:hypothetical protein
MGFLERSKVDGTKGHKVEIMEVTRNYVMCAFKLIMVDEIKNRGT